MRQDIYVLVVHKSGVGFALNRSYKVVLSEIKNAQDWFDQSKRLATIEVLDSWVGWLPSAGWQRPAWIEGIPEGDFTAYWLDHAQAEAAV